ncbi:hypothetical protein GH714_039670 [Hevea brasiliensis]|uniref:Methyltransferase type 11 domain-containing protein n=1 Tax=Hevea brasiliensis TaxID=3981 RepID=A0A6A6MHE5_HEVBR|nr:hypothetical protein GH714_039646 [Hevea brasiliensis]KAF2312694.1 hypothetical protein GH714_039670 [Hevea brasiliensis]
MTMGTSTQAYGEPWYWDNRYANESGPFDWYQKYDSLAPLINLYAPRYHRPRILVVGCGNSAFSEGMVDDGYEDVVNVDISSVVIEAMQKKYFNRPPLKYIQMDVRDMSTFQTGSFDAVIDKGTLDSILCGNNSRQNAAKMLEEVWRVLRDKGVYILVTYGAPVYRLRLLRESYLWRIKLHVIEKLFSGGVSEHPMWELTNPVPLGYDGNSVEVTLGKNPDVHYIYVCTKDESLKPDQKHNVTVD